jgi:KUP system potassium uptake protein
MLPPGHGHGAGASLAALGLAALGVVYGDIGTSPLYAFRECFMAGGHGAPRTPENVLGVLSLIFWSLIVVISIKYLVYVMRADDKGEGGILALMALALPPRQAGQITGRTTLIIGLGLFGSGLLFGDGIITPAISVLSAVEGIKDIAPSLSFVVIPVTIAVLVVFFFFQSRGSAKIGAIFGPVMVVWFLTLGILGASWIVKRPEVFAAVWPGHALQFFATEHFHSFLVLGSVFLVVTGGEALYADMGHFGLRPIRVTWYCLVLPCLLLNYFGQGALVLSDPSAFDSPFYGLAPRWGLIPLVVLATFATIIASQAVISGVFSLARQAAMLGYWPRLRIAHTSDQMMGQIYVPSINWIMMLATIALVVGFGASTNLASAYGIAVTGTMVITTVLAFVVTQRRWKWPLPISLAVTAAILCFDLAFLGANVFKIGSGGELPLLIAAGVYVLMSTWHYGRQMLGEYVKRNLVPLEDFYELMRVEIPKRVPGTAVFMTSNPEGTPPALIHNFLHNHVVHETVVLLTVATLDTARVKEEDRVSSHELQDGFYRVKGRYGFMESPDVQDILQRSGIPGLAMEHTTFFLGREIPLVERGRPSTWRHKLFTAMARNSANATTFFNLPPDRVMEIGYQLEL